MAKKFRGGVELYNYEMGISYFECRRKQHFKNT